MSDNIRTHVSNTTIGDNHIKQTTMPDLGGEELVLELYGTGWAITSMTTGPETSAPRTTIVLSR